VNVGVDVPLADVVPLAVAVEFCCVLLELPPTDPPKLSPTVVQFLSRYPYCHRIERHAVSQRVPAQHSLYPRSTPDRQRDRQPVVGRDQRHYFADPARKNSLARHPRRRARLPHPTKLRSKQTVHQRANLVHGFKRHHADQAAVLQYPDGLATAPNR
jgi:hypothetical protein